MYAYMPTADVTGMFTHIHSPLHLYVCTYLLIQCMSWAMEKDILDSLCGCIP